MQSGWVFCRVIDNFGDVGVSWRLCQGLLCEANWPIVLWIDDLDALQTLVPETKLNQNIQQIKGIWVVHWIDERVDEFLPIITARHEPSWVIETFACDLPEAILPTMKTHTQLWLNLEYLTAENWAKDMHMMPSLQGNGLSKYFYFLGFDDKSGGLIREQDYEAQKKAFETHQYQIFRESLGLPAEKNGLSVFMFAYENPCFAHWFTSWHDTHCQMELLISSECIWQSLSQVSGIRHEQYIQWGQIKAYRLPMVAQAQFDALLWLADLLLVRGEESFVRAQLAGKPFLWHIYQQEDYVHLDKLHAFWQPIAHQMTPELAQAFTAISNGLNDDRASLNLAKTGEAWEMMWQHWQTWQNLAQEWSESILMQDSAIQKLASLIKSKVK